MVAVQLVKPWRYHLKLNLQAHKVAKCPSWIESFSPNYAEHRFIIFMHRTLQAYCLREPLWQFALRAHVNKKTKEFFPTDVTSIISHYLAIIWIHTTELKFYTGPQA